jgi:glycerol kinase
MASASDGILVLDAGTSSVRAIAFGADGPVRAVAQRPLTRHVRGAESEHDPAEIRDLAFACAREAVTGVGGQVAALGIANQRETVVAWDKTTGQPLHRAIVWDDRRTAAMCEDLRRRGYEPQIQAATGLLLDPYFSATKMRWLLDNVPAVAAAAGAGTLAFGTVDSWLAWHLTGGAHITDASNASRTSLLALVGAQWDAGLCDAFGVPRGALPEVVDSHGNWGACDAALIGAAIPFCGMAGDQQAATIGQGCLNPGEAKATFGTGAFMLANMGGAIPRSGHRLLGTVLMQQAGTRTYALEGSVFTAGSLIAWLRDNLGLIGRSDETAALAASVSDSAGVVLVPALTGLGAPHWRPEARGVITGLTAATQRGHIVRAALEAMAHQTFDLAAAFKADGADWTKLRIDGGMSANDWMAQDIADILNLEVERPDMVETTALGAAMLAAVGAGIHADLGTAATAMRGEVRSFAPQMDAAERGRRLSGWRGALAKV